jgi:hypothetical protein
MALLFVQEPCLSSCNFTILSAFMKFLRAVIFAAHQNDPEQKPRLSSQ